MNDEEIVLFLQQNGACEVCQLRYLKVKEASDYCDPLKKLQTLCLKDADNMVEENSGKKRRLNETICPLCLGLFSTEFQNELVEKIMATDIAKFDCDTVAIGISTPMMVQIRQLSMWFALLNKFGDSVGKNVAPDIAMKDVIKLIINPIICKRFDKTYDTNGILINVVLSHNQDEKEVKLLTKIYKKCLPPVKGKYKEISRGLLEKLFTPSQIKSNIFEEFLPTPPKAPTAALSVKDITIAGPTIYVAGRYRKISRVLSHTPWVLHGKRMMEDSIEEILTRSIAPHFSFEKDKINFMSSGREDVDVRCLGLGRPFVLEIPNCHRTKFEKSEAHQMEMEIDKSLKVSARDIQLVQREELVHIKSGEEHKRKYYRALCKLEEPATSQMLEKLNSLKSFDIQQKTPLRVLHRRPLHTRTRMVYSVKAFVQAENPLVLIMEIISEAGTYIKELVHGEFGRTIPSIASIIGKPIDIQALDVMAIELDWPKLVDNSVE